MKSAPRWFESQGVAAYVGAVDRPRDALGVLRGYLEQREALEQADVTDRLAVEAGSGRHGVDDVGLGEPGGAAAGGDQLRVDPVGLGVVRLAVPARALDESPTSRSGACTFDQRRIRLTDESSAVVMIA